MRQKATLFPSPPLPSPFLFFIFCASLSTLRQKVSLFISDHLFCHTVRAQLPNLAKYPFYLLYFLSFFLAFPDTPSYSTSSSSTSCCFRNFMLLTNFSLSGLLFTRGSPSRELRLTPYLPRLRLMFYCCCC